MQAFAKIHELLHPKKSLAHIFRLADWAVAGILEAGRNLEAER